MENILLGVPSLALVAFVVYLLARGEIRRRIRELEAGAVRRPEDDFEWKVVVNGVDVGVVRDSILDKIWLMALRDRELYFNQAMNTLGVASRVLNECLSEIPVFMFWVVALVVVALPLDVGGILAAIKSGELDVTEGFAAALMMSAFILLMVKGYKINACGRDFGQVDIFRGFVELAVRIKCGCAADGEMILRKGGEEDIVVNSSLRSGKAWAKG